MSILKSAVTLFLLCTSLCFNIASANPPQAENAELQTMLEQLIQEQNIPGVVVTYGFDNQPLQTIAAGFSNISAKTPMQNQTQFMIGSVTKSFISAAILQEVAAGKMNVDESLQSIAKQYGGEIASVVKTYPATAPITLRELLDHTSGVHDDVNTSIFTQAFMKDPKKVWTDQELLAIALPHPFYFKPGTKGVFSYTNTDYLLLSIVLKSATHHSLGQTFQQLFTQADLTGIYYPENGVIPPDIFSNMALGYMSLNDSNPLRVAFQDAPVVTIPGISKLQAYELYNDATIPDPSAGGLISSTENMAKWYRALFQNGNILPPAELQMMLHGGVPNGKYNQAHYGFGVATNVIPPYGYIVSHNGQMPGYTAIVFYFFQSHLVVAAAINSSQSDFLDPFDYSTGKPAPGLFSTIIPVLLKEQTVHSKMLN